ADLSGPVHDHVNDPSHVLVGTAADLLAENALDLQTIENRHSRLGVIRTWTLDVRILNCPAVLHSLREISLSGRMCGGGHQQDSRCCATGYRHRGLPGK